MELVGVDDGGEDALVEELAGKFRRANWCAKETTSFQKFNADGRVGRVGTGGDGVSVDGRLYFVGEGWVGEADDGWDGRCSVGGGKDASFEGIGARHPLGGASRLSS